MNFLQLSEKSVWEQPMQSSYSANPIPHTQLARHRDPSPTASILAVISFVVLSMALVFLTAHLELFGSNRTQGPVHKVRVVQVQP